jgi:hypothetical protein
MSHALIESDLDKVEKVQKIDLHREKKDDRDSDYYPQFGYALRVEAAAMSRHYEVFYCLEKGIRYLIADTLTAAHGKAWWDKSSIVPIAVLDNVKKNVNRERDSGMTVRSDDPIDYTTFGELADIVRENWVDFDSLFTSEKAFSRIMNNLNQLRGPIAHCSPLAADEVVRLQLSVKDWFRLME